MAIVYKNKHHSNPSGLHNKVLWILGESNHESSKIEEVKNEVLSSIGIDLSNGTANGIASAEMTKEMALQIFSWLKATTLAVDVLCNRYIKHLDNVKKELERNPECNT